jgi:hypothetical protein
MRIPPSLLAPLALLLATASCAETGEPIDRDDPNEFDVVTVDQIGVEEPIAYTATNYSFTGPSTMAELNALFDKKPPADFNYYALEPGSPYPIADNCTPYNTRFPTNVVTETALPMTVEGIVTTYPRYFQKKLVCGEDERFYGSYFLQDSTGGILVLRDSRIADFTFGDRVRLKVRGILGGQFDNVPTRAVLIGEAEVVSKANPIYYEQTEAGFAVEDIGKVKRIKGIITLEPTNFNFNEMALKHPTEPGVTWAVSLDRELGQRRPKLRLGDTVEITGPVLDSFGLRMVIYSMGQFNNLTVAAEAGQ